MREFLVFTPTVGHTQHWKLTHKLCSINSKCACVCPFVCVCVCVYARVRVTDWRAKLLSPIVKFSFSFPSILNEISNNLPRLSTVHPIITYKIITILLTTNSSFRKFKFIARLNPSAYSIYTIQTFLTYLTDCHYSKNLLILSYLKYFGKLYEKKIDLTNSCRIIVEPAQE